VEAKQSDDGIDDTFVSTSSWKSSVFKKPVQRDEFK